MAVRAFFKLIVKYPFFIYLTIGFYRSKSRSISSIFIKKLSIFGIAAKKNNKSIELLISVPTTKRNANTATSDKHEIILKEENTFVNVISYIIDTSYNNRLDHPIKA